MLNFQKLRPLLSRPLLKRVAVRPFAYDPKSESHGSEKSFEVIDKTGIVFTLSDQPGVLNKALDTLTQHKINLTRIESRPSKHYRMQKAFDFYIDFYGQLGDENVRKAISQLSLICKHLTICGTPEVPWFPTHLSDLNKMGQNTLSEGEGIQMTDHPGFHDEVYKARRNEIAQVAFDYRMEDAAIPRVQYTEEEVGVWNYCFTRLKELYKEGACEPHRIAMEHMERQCGYAPNNIPQLDDISKFLLQQTGWRLRPVGGLLTQREFLNGLAFKTFHSTQYIRHSSTPLYTPEPDIVHELMGHAPMFADPLFAEFSQEIGLASLGANDEDIKKLGTLYWFTIEFGLCFEKGKRKAYGAGVLSSVGEMEWALSDEPAFYDLDPFEVALNHQDFPISSKQPYYFVAESFQKAKDQMIDFSESLARPFNVIYNPVTYSVEVDRKIKARHEDPAVAGGMMA